jgi:hypothetical protein
MPPAKSGTATDSGGDFSVVLEPDGLDGIR